MNTEKVLLKYLQATVFNDYEQLINDGYVIDSPARLKEFALDNLLSCDVEEKDKILLMLANNTDFSTIFEKLHPFSPVIKYKGTNWQRAVKSRHEKNKAIFKLHDGFIADLKSLLEKAEAARDIKETSTDYIYKAELATALEELQQDLAKIVIAAQIAEGVAYTVERGE